MSAALLWLDHLSPVSRRPFLPVTLKGPVHTQPRLQLFIRAAWCTQNGKLVTRKMNSLEGARRLPVLGHGSPAPDPSVTRCTQRGVFLAAVKQLVKRTIREIRPQVVLLELDADSIFLLPAGKAQQVSCADPTKAGAMNPTPIPIQGLPSTFLVDGQALPTPLSRALLVSMLVAPHPPPALACLQFFRFFMCGLAAYWPCCAQDSNGLWWWKPEPLPEGEPSGSKTAAMK